MHTKKLFWCDSKRSTIESSTYDGTDHKIIFRGLEKPVLIGLYKDSVYLTEGYSANVIQFNITMNKLITLVQPYDTPSTDGVYKALVIDRNDIVKGK